jgi:hypothetical protein
MRAACPAHFILLDLIVLITFSEKYMLRRCSLRSYFLHNTVTSFCACPNIFSTVSVKKCTWMCVSRPTYVAYNLPWDIWQTDVYIDRKIYGRTDRRMYGLTDEQLEKRMTGTTKKLDFLVQRM